MKKIIHIHSDPKFIKINLDRYDSSRFENHLLFIGDNEIETSNFIETLKITASKSSIQDAVIYASKADFVIVNELDTFKSRIINKLPKKIKIAWRFFGYELYGRKKELYLSDLTQQVIRNNRNLFSTTFNSLLDCVKSFLRPMKWESSHELEFKNAIKRIDYFLGLYKEEYIHLKKIWPNLPEFISLPLRNPEDFNSGYLKEKRPIVIIGNNRSAYNNHLDILKIIKNSSVKECVKFTLLFNYADDYSYSEAVLDLVKEIESAKVIEYFLTYEEFLDLYSSVGALVINGYRQMAMANIRQALGSGVKVYLNKKNTTYDYLLSNNFKVFCINEFKDDIETGDIILDTSVKSHNYEMLQKLYTEKTIQDFQKELIDLI